MPTDETLRVTHALLRPETVAAAAEALRGDPSAAAAEGLVELLYRPHPARAALAAVAALEGSRHPAAADGLIRALDSTHNTVRAAAAQALHRRREADAEEALARLLRRDESWVVRRAALRALADLAGDRWDVLVALDDPHWRVRHALIDVLLCRGDTDGVRREIAERVSAAGRSARAEGVLAYLHYRSCGERLAPAPAAEDPRRRVPFWDWDVAVLARNLERMGPEGRRLALDSMPFLLGHPDERVRGPALDALRRWGEPRHLAEAIGLLDEPRDGAGEAVTKLLGYLDLDRAEEVARFVFRAPARSPEALAWALDQTGDAVPFEDEQTLLTDLLARAADQPATVRCALARLAARSRPSGFESVLRGLLADSSPEVQREALRGWIETDDAGPPRDVLVSLSRSRHGGLRAEVAAARCGAADLSESLEEDPSAEVRVRVAECLTARGSSPALLRSDPHPLVRAAALTPESAAELVREPGRETSWHVLTTAARMAKVPAWRLAPERPWSPGGTNEDITETLHLKRTSRTDARRLGAGGPLVARVGVSGHYGLPVEGFVRAVEAGVNLLFWEPNYQTLTEFTGRLPAADRAALHFITGTFEADGERVRRDAERALRLLRIDRISLFLMFWVQSWDRITPDVQDALERLKHEGKVAAFSLSTHARPLAVEAMEAGWGPVMVRHSAAHRGAEDRILPRALELGRGIITFNNTCYGRLLKPRRDSRPPRAADCYRYTLAQTGVTVCLSAPATLEELDDNLTALRDPTLAPEQLAELRRHGDAVYEEDSVFRELVRSR